ncbi:MAG: CPBP family intramembrane metalloprotease [Lachnospiraceae bacterium]|nr:CPBP family intramembrane metalloprotease [Lachnospiraceae bacterium]
MTNNDILYDLRKNRGDGPGGLSGKKNEFMSIALFLLISFGLMFTFGPVVYVTDAADTAFSGIFYTLAAFSPCIACIITRYRFHEGFRDGILYPKFTGHGKAYVLAVLLPLAYGVLSCILVTVCLGAGFSFKMEGGIYTALANNMIMSVEFYYAMIILIGEELGWRAFLYDKLEKLFGLHGSLIIGGIIWGLWHTPAIVHMGLNYGLDHPGFPYVGIALMCVMCTGFGAVMQLLRKMSNSVIAPIIAHAIIDTVGNTLISMFLTQELADGRQFTVGVCITVAAVIIGIPCWIYMDKKYKNIEGH